jgi:hypothetical protein
MSGFDSPCTAPGPRGDAPAATPTGLYRTANAARRSPDQNPPARSPIQKL